MNDGPEALETALELCASADRRIILAIFVSRPRTVTLNDLVKEIIEHGHDAPITDVPSEDVTGIYLRVYHEHVPKLVDAGVLSYDEQRRRVGPTDRFDALRPYLTTIIEMDPELDVSETM